MSDLDAELLALAGDSSDDEGQSEQPTKNNAIATSPEVAGPPQAGVAAATNGNGSTTGPAGDAKRTSPAKSPTPKKRTLAGGDEGRRVTKKNKRADSEEHAASSRPSTSSSLQSAPMSESDSGNDPTGTEARMAKVKVDGRSISKAEKAKIMSLPEIQREALLADRATFKERDKQNRMLMQLLRDKDRNGDDDDEVPEKKRKADTAEIGDPQRRSTRQKTTLGGRKVGETSAALDEYKQKRAHAEQRKRDEARRPRASTGVRPASRSSADGESVDGSPRGKGISPRGPATPPVTTIPDELPTLKDYNRCRLGRSAFGHVCLYPGFDEAITGCFVRVNVGNHPDTGEIVYRMAQIKRFTEGVRYAITATNGRNFVTNQFALASHGKAEREWPFIMCSDSAFTQVRSRRSISVVRNVRLTTQAEVDRFHRICEAEEVPLPTARFVRNKVDGIHRLINRKWTEAELQTKLVRQNAIRNSQASMHISALKKERILAIDKGDEAWIARIDAQLAEFNPKLAFGTKLFERNLLEEESEESILERERAEAEERRKQREKAEELARSKTKNKSQTQTLIGRPKPSARRRLARLVQAKAQSPSQSQEDLQAAAAAREIDELFEDDEEENNDDATVRKAGGITMSRPSFVDDDEFLAAIDLGIEIPEL